MFRCTYIFANVETDGQNAAFWLVGLKRLNHTDDARRILKKFKNSLFQSVPNKFGKLISHRLSCRFLLPDQIELCGQLCMAWCCCTTRNRIDPNLDNVFDDFDGPLVGWLLAQLALFLIYGPDHGLASRKFDERLDSLGTALLLVMTTNHQIMSTISNNAVQSFFEFGRWPQSRLRLAQ